MGISGPGTHYSRMPNLMPLSATKTPKLMKFLPGQTFIMLFSKTTCASKSTITQAVKMPSVEREAKEQEE